MDAFEQALMSDSKTPLMWLHEICVKQGCSMPHFVERDLKTCQSDPPKYELTAIVFNFQGKDYSEKGVGRKKKDAKQKSAVNILYAMGIRLQDLEEMKISNKKRVNPYRVVGVDVDVDANVDERMEADSTVTATATAPPNPKTADDSLVNDTLIKAMRAMEINVTSVVELIDLCEKRFLPSPEYELVGDEGPSHCKTFTMTCRIRTKDHDDHVTTGIDSNKKKAKQRAAMLMLDKLRSMKHSEDTLRDLVSRTLNKSIVDGSLRLRALCTNRKKCKHLISHTQHCFPWFSGAAIRRLNDETDKDKDKDVDDRDYEAILAEIKDEEKFEVEFKEAPLPAPEDSGPIHCYCKLTNVQSASAPALIGLVGRTPFVFVGSGVSAKLAREDSARKSLKFLKEMTRP